MPYAGRIKPQERKFNVTWQTDITHPSEFGCFKFVHVMVGAIQNMIDVSVQKVKLLQDKDIME